MSRFLSTLVCAALLAAGCSSNPNEPEVTYPVTLTLQAGETAAAGGLFVKFVEVSNDFRCPINAMCINAGDAFLEFELSTDRRFIHQRLQVFDANLRKVSLEGYSVEVKDLMPGLDTSRLMSQSEYKVTLTVNR
jgi:hypothetical protein